MAKKITELNAATLVKSSDVVVYVDLVAAETKKATWVQVVAGINDLVATVSGSTFTGPVVGASNGGFTGSLTRLAGGVLPFITAVAGNVITISTGSLGQIIFSGSGGTASGGGSSGGGDPGAQYLVLAFTASLPNERIFTPGTGLFSTDAGAGAAYTIGVNDRFFAGLTGSTFSGPIRATGGLSGSLQNLTDGTSFLVGVGGITITSQSNGQIFISASAGGSGGSGTVTAQYLTLATDATLTAERVLVPSTGLFSSDTGANGNFTIGVNDRFFAGLTGSTFSGPIVGTNAGGFTGSHTQLVGGAPFITALAGNVITITTGSLGQIILSGSGGVNQGAPLGAQYLTLTSNPELTVERVFTPGTGLFSTDAGAGAAYTIGVNDRFFAALTGSIFTGVVSFDSGAVSGLTRGTDVFAYFSGSCGLTGSSVNTPATRRAVVFAGDMMLSGTFQEQRPIQSPNVYKHNILTQSVTADATPLLVYRWQIANGSTVADVQFLATRANSSQASVIGQKALFRNNAGTVTLVGSGSISTGLLCDTGLAWSANIINAGAEGRVFVTGSAAITITWAIDGTITTVTP